LEIKFARVSGSKGREVLFSYPGCRVGGGVARRRCAESQLITFGYLLMCLHNNEEANYVDVFNEEWHLGHDLERKYIQSTALLLIILMSQILSPI